VESHLATGSEHRDWTVDLSECLQHASRGFAEETIDLIGRAGKRAGESSGNAASIRERTDKPFGINHLLFQIKEDMFAKTLAAKPALIAFAWARREQNLRDYCQRAHDSGCKVMHMAGEVSEALRAAEAGADVLVAQGTEAGGHVGWMASLPLVPMMVKALAPLPVLCAGGIADGRGLAAALAMGAEGVLLGTRFLATNESPLHPNFKQAIVDSDGHDTVLTEIPDLASQRVWPGAMSRAKRNRFIERWAGREWSIRQNAGEIGKELAQARAAGDIDNASLSYGQDAGLIDSIKSVKKVIEDIIAEAEEIIKGRLPKLAQ
jgi:NAD(P)H-dependent flavin oxidoreductase YrpB (nitropropane dioxygenase family)